MFFIIPLLLNPNNPFPAGSLPCEQYFILFPYFSVLVAPVCTVVLSVYLKIFHDSMN